jgi:Na+-transporting NADH:ubiquinone oxidoreductase subunit NqrD
VQTDGFKVTFLIKEEKTSLQCQQQLACLASLVIQTDYLLEIVFYKWNKQAQNNKYHTISQMEGLQNT